MRLALTSWLILPALGALLVSACQPGRRSDPAPLPAPSSCGPSVPETAQHPIALRAASLAGDYDLFLVRTQPATGVTKPEHLALTPLDSTSRAAAVGGAVRDLVGTAEAEGGRITTSAVLAGQHLRLGPRQDGSIQSLTITAVATEGFWGWWKSDRGMAVAVEPGSKRVVPDPAGYFCALRRNSAR